MSKHNGAIVEHVIRSRGYNLVQLSTDLKITRKTMYNWFGQRYLKAEIIVSIGKKINHDFSAEFPELFTPEDFTAPQQMMQNEEFANGFWKDRYLKLFEKYNKALNNKLMDNDYK
jgi:lambda repressor-like predicted transcriptional regulator